MNEEQFVEKFRDLIVVLVNNNGKESLPYRADEIWQVLKEQSSMLDGNPLPDENATVQDVVEAMKMSFWMAKDVKIIQEEKTETCWKKVSFLEDQVATEPDVALGFIHELSNRGILGRHLFHYLCECSSNARRAWSLLHRYADQEVRDEWVKDRD